MISNLLPSVHLCTRSSSCIPTTQGKENSHFCWGIFTGKNIWNEDPIFLFHHQHDFPSKQQHGTHCICVPVKGSEVERSPSLPVRLVQVCACLHQKLHGTFRSLQTGPAERSQPLLISSGQRGTCNHKWYKYCLIQIHSVNVSSH